MLYTPEGMYFSELFTYNSCAQKDPEILKKIHTVEHERNVFIGKKLAKDQIIKFRKA
jgi:hypothetical protein